MAEAAGLALGGVALVSLFTTCKECLDYIELGRGYASDYGLAATKIEGLRQRLYQWGENQGFIAAEDRLSKERDGLPNKWDMIAATLLGIKTTLSTTSELLHKYDFKKEHWSLRQIMPIPFLPIPFRSEESHQEQELQRKSLTSFRRKTVWAIKDKQKLDRLIIDLETLIGNLEKVGISRQARNFTTRAGKPTQNSQVTDSNLLPVENELSEKAGIETTTMPNSKADTGKARPIISVAAFDTTPYHEYVGNRVTNSRVLQGDGGDAPVKEHGNSYRTNVSNDSNVIMGNSSTDAVKELFSAKEIAAQEEHTWKK